MTESAGKILIVDDEPNMLHMLGSVLKQDGFEPSTASSGREALEMAAEDRFDFILSDVRMPGMDGIQLLTTLREQGIDAVVIMMSAYGTVELALEAMRKGAYDYIAKPFKTDEVVLTLRKAAERERLRREVIKLKRRLKHTEGRPELIAKSPAMQAILQTVEQTAPYDTSVLITGDSGTGKELTAREIHLRSPRAENPFVAVNCGALPEGLLESELFGHTKGAFTGATSAKPGLFEEADSGTLLLDEIGTMSAGLQVKILRAVDTGAIRRLGETRERKVSVRILAATNEDLQDAIARGDFREDLYYRLGVMHIHIPPLRERPEDIVPLVEHFTAVCNKKLGTKITRIERAAQELLLSYSWPGNVRELQNVIERSIILTASDALTVESLPADLRNDCAEPVSQPDDDGPLALKKAVKGLEKTLIMRALNRTGGNRSQAASLLEISYPSLLQKIKEHGLS